ncbi:hypothetical protein NNG48_06935 [Enterococcus faecium]|nr:hypothetical protein [Enterococcus faecium]
MKLELTETELLYVIAVIGGMNDAEDMRACDKFVDAINEEDYDRLERLPSEGELRLSLCALDKFATYRKFVDVAEELKLVR